MTAAEFDPVKFKDMQRANWNAISAGWASSQDDFERGGAAVTARLLELAGVKPGQTVLDVGTGVGEPALTVADVVGPTGRVVGVDLAPAMVAIATERAGAVGNVEFVVGDVESLDFPPASFDVVLSRWGLMFAVDHVKTFQELANVLVPGGVLAASVWVGSVAEVPMMSIGYEVLSARLDLPPAPPGAPGPFSMGDPVALRTELSVAGFVDVEVREFTVPFVLDSVERYVAFNKAASPPGLKDMLRERYGDEDETWDAIGAAAESYRAADGTISLPSKTLLLRAVAPGG